MASRRIYVKHELVGASSDDAISEDDLKDLFTKFGPVEKIWVARRPPGYAFINMASDMDAETALNELKDQPIKGQVVFMEFAREQKRDSTKPGDWRCRSCSANNFARRTECFKCRDPKPYDEDRFAGRRDDRDYDRRRSPPRYRRSPDRRRRSPPRRSRSPPRRSSRSPPRRDRSPPRRDRSPPRRDRSPPRRDRSPPRRDRSSPPRRDRSPPRRDMSPPRRDMSPPRRSRSRD